METEIAELDQLQTAYKEAVEAWITTIREEEALASTEHSVAEIDEWGRGWLSRRRSPRQGQSCKTAVRGRSSEEVLQLLAHHSALAPSGIFRSRATRRTSGDTS